MSTPADLFTARRRAALLLAVLDGQITSEDTPHLVSVPRDTVTELAHALGVFGYSWADVPFYARHPEPVLDQRRDVFVDAPAYAPGDPLS